MHRSDLDDFDSETWEVDEDGDRMDPWQKTTLIVLVSATVPHDLFTFSTARWEEQTRSATCARRTPGAPKASDSIRS